MSAATGEPAAAAAASLQARDPATGEPLGSVQATPPMSIGGVVAEIAQVQPLWALLRIQDRARYMRGMAQAVIDDFDELASALAREQGRPAAEIAALELLPAIGASASAAGCRWPSARAWPSSPTASSA
jgi:acyl-CoA reductase-like NAD-dependent aldehyde dehydrogenase